MPKPPETLDEGLAGAGAVEGAREGFEVSFSGLSEKSMGFLVRRTFQSFTRVLEARLAPYDVSISMWYFLRLLWEGDGRTQKDVGDELGLAPPTIVAAMDNLERRGLIRRERNPTDRRKVNIYLTPRGQALKKDLVGFAHEVNAVALQDLHSAEIGMLRFLLQRVNRSLQREHRGAPGRLDGLQEPGFEFLPRRANAPPNIPH